MSRSNRLYAGITLILLGLALKTGVPAGIIQAIVPQAVPIANKQGNGTLFQLSTGAATTGDCVKFDANGNTVDNGSACAAGTSGATFFSSTTNAGPNNSAAETSIIGTVTGSKTIPANTFLNGEVLDVVSEGFYSTPMVPDNLTVKLKCGTTVVAQTGAFAPPLRAVTNGTFTLRIVVTAIGTGAAGAFIANGELLGSDGAGGFNQKLLNTSTVAFDFTTACAFDVTAQWAAGQMGELFTGTVVSAWVPGAPVASVGGLTGAVPGEGNGSKVQLFTGADPATNDCAKFDVNHNIVGNGSACGGGGSGNPYINPNSPTAIVSANWADFNMASCSRTTPQTGRELLTSNAAASVNICGRTIAFPAGAFTRTFAVVPDLITNVGLTGGFGAIGIGITDGTKVSAGGVFVQITAGIPFLFPYGTKYTNATTSNSNFTLTNVPIVANDNLMFFQVFDDGAGNLGLRYSPDGTTFTELWTDKDTTGAGGFMTPTNLIYFINTDNSNLVQQMVTLSFTNP